MSKFVLSLGSSEATLSQVGGKGANLNRMARAGLPVPPGFPITTTAYRAFVQAQDLQKRMVDLARDAAEISERGSTAIHQLFVNGAIPADPAQAIRHAYADLIRTIGELPLAVRSSSRFGCLGNLPSLH